MCLDALSAAPFLRQTIPVHTERDEDGGVSSSEDPGRRSGRHRSSASARGSSFTRSPVSSRSRLKSCGSEFWVSSSSRTRSRSDICWRSTWEALDSAPCSPGTGECAAGSRRPRFCCFRRRFPCTRHSRWLRSLQQSAGSRGASRSGITWRPTKRSDESDIAGLQLLLAVYGIVPLWLIGPSTLMMGLSFGLSSACRAARSARPRPAPGMVSDRQHRRRHAGGPVTGLVLLHWLGSAGTLRLLVCCGGVFLWMYARAGRQRFGGWPLSAAVIILVSVAVLVPSAGRFWARLHAAPEAQVIYAEDSSGLSLLKKGAGVSTIVYANGLGQSLLPYGGDLHTVPARCRPSYIQTRERSQ